MLKQIQALLQSLDSKAVDYQLDKDVWKQIVELYGQCSSEQQNILISGLSQRFKISNTTLNDIFILFNTNETDDSLLEQTLVTFCDAQILAENEKIVSYKERAAKHLPELALMKQERKVWLELIRCFEMSKKKYLTRNFLLAQLSDITKVNYNSYVSLFSRELPSRQVKKQTDKDSTPKIRLAKQRHGSINVKNELILQLTQDNNHLHSPLRKTGVRIALLEPATPEKGYKTLHKTPGNTKVRPYYSNPQGSFFKPLTPYGKKDASGMVDISRGKRSEVLEQIPTLHFERPGPISFIATLEKLRERANKHRGVSQLQLTGARCHDIFKALGSEEFITISGHDYHWSHLIAHFLGGEQSKNNLIPGTAASNYNTLELVEQFIAGKLLQDEITRIEITVTPSYSGESFIPDELIFDLKWGTTNFEKIHINPRSYNRITGSMHKSIDLLRSIDDEHNGKEPESLQDDLFNELLAPQEEDDVSIVPSGDDAQPEPNSGAKRICI